jgi:hypothetical protein
MNRKLVVTAIAGLFSLPLFAQEMTVTANRTTFGIRAGVNFQNINGKNSAGDELENGITTGFHGGINAEIPVGTGSYIQPGVLYSMKGAEQQDSDNKVKLSYIEVPINFVYKPILGTGNMVLGFGPYVAWGIGGKTKIAGTEYDIVFKDTYTNNASANVFKRFDAGGNLLAGYEFANKVSFQVNAQLGLVNINPELEGASGDKTKWRNTGFGLSLGYRF